MYKINKSDIRQPIKIGQQKTYSRTTTRSYLQARNCQTCSTFKHV